MTPGCRHIILSFLFVLCHATLRAQTFTPVDYTALDVDMSFNPAAYDNLLERFENADPSLDTSGVSRLYYGFVYTPAFDPHYSAPAMITTAIESGDWTIALDMLSDALQDNTLSLDLNMKAAIAARNCADSAASSLMARVNMLVAAILASGLGTIPQAPFYVTSYDDAITLVREVFGARDIIGRSTVGEIDAIKFTLDDDPDRQHILYFNTYRKPHNNL